MKIPLYKKYDGDEEKGSLWREWWDETYGNDNVSVRTMYGPTQAKLLKTWDKIYKKGYNIMDAVNTGNIEEVKELCDHSDRKACMKAVVLATEKGYHEIAKYLDSHICKKVKKNVIVCDPPYIFYIQNNKMMFRNRRVCLIVVGRSAECPKEAYSQFFCKAVCFPEIKHYYVYVGHDWLKDMSHDSNFPINVYGKNKDIQVYMSANGVLKSKYDSTNFDEWLSHNYLEHLIEDGDINYFKFYYSKSRSFPRMMEFASSKGKLETAKFCHSVGMECSPDAMDYACVEGHFDVFIYLSSCGYLYTKKTLNYLVENKYDEYIKMLYAQNPVYFNGICLDVSSDTRKYLLDVVTQDDSSDESEFSAESEENTSDMCVANSCKELVITRDHEFCKNHFRCSMCHSHHDCYVIYKTILCDNCRPIYKNHYEMYIAYIKSRFPSKFQMWCWAAEYLNRNNAFDGLRQVASRTNYSNKELCDLHSCATLSDKLCEDVYTNVNSIVNNREIGKDIDIAKAVVTWMIA